MIARVSSAAIFQSTISDIGRQQVDLSKLQEQISSGRIASSFKELGTQTNRVFNLERSLAENDQFVRSNNTTISRLKAMELAVSDLEEIASELASNLVIKRSAAGQSFDIAQFANVALERVSDALNTQFDGRTLFGGGKTDQPAVNENTLINTSNVDFTTSVVDSGYYQGDNLRFTTQANKQLNIEYGILASDTSFQKLVGALHMAKNAETAGGQQQNQLERAVNLVNEAVQELADTRSDINFDVVTLQNVNDLHAQVNVELESTLADVIATDVVEASVLVSQTEATLTATFQTFARISQLSLSDFLR